MKQSYDVVVVGGRVAGAATALVLAREGLRVLVLERGRYGTDTLSTHALMRGGAALLHRWGVLLSLAAAGTPAVRQVRFHHPDESTTVSIKPAVGVDALYAPRRTLLDATLVGAATAAGAEVRFGVTVTDLLRDPDGRVVGVVGEDRSGARLTARAPLTIGADGARSVVARCTGARVERVGDSSSAVVYGHWKGLAATAYEWFYRPVAGRSAGGSAGFIPTNDGEVCVFVALPADRFTSAFAGDLHGGYQRLLHTVTGGADGRLAAVAPPDRLRAFPGRAGYLRQASGPGWALVGDAGYFLDPLSAHGMTDALRDVHLLTRSVLAMCSGEPDATALARYQSGRDSMSAPVFGIVDEIAGYGWDTPHIRQLLLQLNSAMSDELEALLRMDW